MKKLISLLWLPLTYLLCIHIAKAEGIYSAELVAIDDSQWPRVNLLLKVTDDSRSPGDLRRPPTPFGCEAGLEQLGWSCWKIELSENGRNILEIRQINVPLRPRDNWNYLWLSYRSELDSLDEGTLTLHLDIPQWELRSSHDQPLLYLHQAREPKLAGSPWRYLLSQSDEVLNANYQHLLEVTPKGLAESLRQAQRAWLRFRDADCLEMSSIYQQRCLYLRTQERVELLQQMLRE